MRKGSMFVSSSNLVTTVAFLIVGSLLLLLGGGPSTSFGSGVVAFQIPLARPHGPLASLYGMTMSTKTERFLSSPSPSEQYEPEDEEATDETPALAVVAAAASKAVEEESPSYPLDVPSPILLASSMVIAIASTGSLFELMGGTPKFGFAPTAAIVALGFPITLFLFYASIRKAVAETEEDDKRFLSGQ